jgi:hypothetical protein
MTLVRDRRPIAVIAAAAACLLLIAPMAPARMRSTPLGPKLCETVGGGRFVGIPGFPGERIDRRLLRDIRWMRRRYEIFITDGYATSGHTPNGEHPIGLAIDVVPPWGRGWSLIADLANWAEPHQNDPRPPFRWVGWNGDPGHGRGDHLHLSWMHSPTPPRDPARVVYTRRCPDGAKEDPPKPSSGGVSPKRTARLAPVVTETGGVGVGEG